jgi:hypothetical protein
MGWCERQAESERGCGCMSWLWSIIVNLQVMKACLSCFGNGNKMEAPEGSMRSLQKPWIVKIILGQFSRFLQQTWKSATSVFVSFLGVSVLFHNASSA